jgi:hypothetical protein
MGIADNRNRRWRTRLLQSISDGVNMGRVNPDFEDFP